MSKWAKRIDANQPLIVDTLREIGCTVQPLHTVGQGFPDLLAGFSGFNLLIEVKTEGGRLNPTEKEWHAEWRGQVCVVRTMGDAIALVNRWREYARPAPRNVA